MSVHCVDGVIELANSVRHPLMLVASRRQIEGSKWGGGYVNNWTTETFAGYVRKRDHGGFVVLCRDHGGPWQNYREVECKLTLAESMAFAKESITVDLESGLEIIHLDPSIDIHGEINEDQVFERLCDLYHHCMTEAKRLQTEVAIEVGGEEQSGLDQDLNAFVQFLTRLTEFCRCNHYPLPLFVVGQTGTLVKETQNVGIFDDPFRRNSTMPAEIQVPKVIDICKNCGVYLKEHNADYLMTEALVWHPRLGIHAVNIGPELGVTETRQILKVCDEFGFSREKERFLELAYASRKWEKWLLPQSTASDFDRAVIAGHYVFGSQEFQDLMSSLRVGCTERGLDLNQSIKDNLKLVIMRYLCNFHVYNGT